MKKFYTKEYFRQRNHLDRLIADSLLIKIREENYKTLLDVGCGTGQLVAYLNKKSVKAKGCDPYPGALTLARKINSKNTIFNARASKLPFKDDSFDLITAISTIEHLTEKEVDLFIKEAKRVLKKGGSIFLITPNFNSLFRLIRGKNWYAFSDPTHINFYTPKKIKGLLEKHKFNQIKFRHTPAYNIDFNWYLPKFLWAVPMPVKNFLTYLLIASPFVHLKESIWVVAKK